MRIVTWNVNSIKVRAQHARQLISDVSPHLILMQELKCEESNFPHMLFGEYKCIISGQKTYNGVAILTKKPFETVSTKLRGYDYPEARYAEIIMDNIRIINVYVPFGEALGSDKFKQKIKFLSALLNYLENLRDDKIIIGGDFNVAVDPIDIYSPLPHSVCFASEVRDIIRHIRNIGYYDPFRALNPQSGKFSWWDYRNKGFENNLGMRLDYFLLSPKLMDMATSCAILDNFRAIPNPSDHAPVLCTMNN